MDYSNKKKLLFDTLDAEEKKLQGSCLEQKETENYTLKRPNNLNNRDSGIERYKKKVSIFKRPELPINKCLRARQRPDYERNPEKYKHYTLSDVSDTSDRLNSSAAFQFLREMEERKRKEEEADVSGSEKIVFRNSRKLKPEREEETEKMDKILGNKFVMKEYVVGEKRQKPKKNLGKLKVSESVKQLRLSHLDDDDE